MASALDSEDQVNRFIQAMMAVQATKSSQAELAQKYSQSSQGHDRNSKPLYPVKDEVQEGTESEDPSFEGGMQLQTANEVPIAPESAPNSPLQLSSSFVGGVELNTDNEVPIVPESCPNSPLQPSSTPAETNTMCTGVSIPEVASPMVSGVRPPPPTPQATAQSHFTDEFDSNEIVQDILGTFAASSPYGLAHSIHAPKHVRDSVNANSPINGGRYTNARDAMRGPLAILHETGSNHNISKIDDTDAFVAAMRARVPAPKSSVSTDSSTNAGSSETTVTADSGVTVKNKENQPFGKEEALGLLISPKTKKSSKGSSNGENASTIVMSSQYPLPAYDASSHIIVQQRERLPKEVPIQPLEETPMTPKTQAPLVVQAAVEPKAKAASPVSPVKHVMPTSAVPKNTLRKHRASLSASFIPVTESVDNEPGKATNGTNSTHDEPEDQDNREHLTHFKTWGDVTRGDRAYRPVSRVRKVQITGLPADISLKRVAACIFHGALESFAIVRKVNNLSFVEATFVSGDGCQAYHDATPNGIRVVTGGTTYNIMIDKDRDVQPVGSQVQEWIDKGFTRCVRAVGIEEDWALPALWRKAEGTKRTTRKVEHVVDEETHASTRLITFRFTNIADAVQFKGELTRDEDWEHCNIQFAPDPCALATKLHND